MAVLSLKVIDKNDKTRSLNVDGHQFQNAQAREAEAIGGAFGFLDRRKPED